MWYYFQFYQNACVIIFEFAIWEIHLFWLTCYIHLYISKSGPHDLDSFLITVVLGVEKLSSYLGNSTCQQWYDDDEKSQYSPSLMGSTESMFFSRIIIIIILNGKKILLEQTENTKLKNRKENIKRERVQEQCTTPNPLTKPRPKFFSKNLSLNVRIFPLKCELVG